MTRGDNLTNARVHCTGAAASRARRAGRAPGQAADTSARLGGRRPVNTRRATADRAGLTPAADMGGGRRQDTEAARQVCVGSTRVEHSLVSARSWQARNPVTCTSPVPLASGHQVATAPATLLRPAPVPACVVMRSRAQCNPRTAQAADAVDLRPPRRQQRVGAGSGRQGAAAAAGGQLGDVRLGGAGALGRRLQGAGRQDGRLRHRHPAGPPACEEHQVRAGRCQLGSRTSLLSTRGALRHSAACQGSGACAQHVVWSQLAAGMSIAPVNKPTTGTFTAGWIPVTKGTPYSPCRHAAGSGRTGRTSRRWRTAWGTAPSWPASWRPLTTPARALLRMWTCTLSVSSPTTRWQFAQHA